MRKTKTLLTAGLFVLSSTAVFAEIWVEQISAVVPPPWTRPTGRASVSDIASDAGGDLYVTGRFTGTAVFGDAVLAANYPPDLDWNIVGEAFVAKMDSAGNWLWASQSQGEPLSASWQETSDIEVRSVVVDGEGNTYITGQFTGNYQFGADRLLALDAGGEPDPSSWNVFVAKLDLEGNWEWARQAGGGGSQETGGRGIAVDAEGNVYIIGTAGPTARRFGPITVEEFGGIDAFLAKLDTQGVWLWAKAIGTSTTDYGYGVAVDGNGYISLTGSSGEVWIERRDNSGRDFDSAECGPPDCWRREIHYVGPGVFVRANDLSIDSTGNVYVAGQFGDTKEVMFDPNGIDHDNVVFQTMTSQGGYDLFAIRYETDGTPLWVKTWGGAGDEVGEAIAVDSTGDVYVTGLANDWLDRDLLTLKWDTLGNEEWTQTLASVGNIYPPHVGTWGRGIAIGRDDEVFLGGELGGTTTFSTDPTDPESHQTRDLVNTSSYENGFLAKLEEETGWCTDDHYPLTVVDVGQPIPWPEDASSDWPEWHDIEILSGPEGSEPSNSLVRGEADHLLYPVRPVVANIAWADPLNPDQRIIRRYNFRWPDEPQIHIAGTPVDLDPAAGAYSYFAPRYLEAGGEQFDVNAPGYAVLQYQDSVGHILFEVVRTLALEQDGFGHLILPAAQDGIAWQIGEPIVDVGHDLAAGNGFVLSVGAVAGLLPPFDGSLYDWAQRVGPIVPVNKVIPGVHDDLVVVWYQASRVVTGLYWGYRPVRYLPGWPAGAPQILIASEQGSGGLDPSLYDSRHIYDQPDTTQPGFNPNEEHALFAPGNDGSGFDALFALRSDLSNPLATSEPYALLKYLDSTTAAWAFKAFKVIGPAPGAFIKSGVAGDPVQPPYPLGRLGNCSETLADTSDTPFWKDHKNGIWARAAGDMDIAYWYPLQPAFYATGLDLDHDLAPDELPGTCVPWLDRLTGTPGPAITVQYQITWPLDAPRLHVGETLTRAKNGLPEILNQAATRIIYDDLNPDNVYYYDPNDPLYDPNQPIAPSLARLIDPLSPRSIALDDLPTEITTIRNEQGKEVPEDLPYHLRLRVSWDPTAKELVFQGHLDETGAGEPLLLLNVMTAAERDLLLALSSDVAYTTAVNGLYDLTRNPRQLDLDGVPGADPDLLIAIQDDEDGDPETPGDGIPEPFQTVGVPAALTAGAADGIGYLTLAFNDDASLGSSPVSLSVIEVVCDPYRGDLKVIAPDNVFDERLTLRHSGDFGAEPEKFYFEWYRSDDPSLYCDPNDVVCAGHDCPPLSGTCTPTSIWELDPEHEGAGLNSITIEGANATTLSDNYFMVRYRADGEAYAYQVCGAVPAEDLWAGSPGSTVDEPYAMLAEGWVKRVVRAFNPFEDRVKAWHTSPSSTYASMLIQLGQRYEGDIAFSTDPDYLNSVGLIEAYETVLRRALALGAGLDIPAVNNQILLAASRIADFYMLLGNEAVADAFDPTIGLGTDSQLGSLAPVIFTFQNQLDSLLEEELTLLRGRDGTAAPTSARPVYNRLFWNFTSGDGELAYSQAYNVTDQDDSGVIDETDARIMFPQGHGDAWGHYLTATKTYYRLLQDPDFTWLPRTEDVLVAGVPVLVDYLDERKFAAAAAAKARAGAEIVDLTYRLNYVEDPGGQWQGYKDPDDTRAWGVDEWSRRAGQGAYIDWVMGNAMLPSEDTAHTGIEKIDRITVVELAENVTAYEKIQTRIDEANAGLNPLGLARGVVPFDIDPGQVDSGKTHFEQIYERSLLTLDNTQVVFDHANQLSQSLRRQQDTVEDFARNVTQQEQDYTNRLIEIYGYPYSDDIGVGGTYPSGYDGPDLEHYMIVERTELTGEATPPTERITWQFEQEPTDPDLPDPPSSSTNRDAPAWMIDLQSLEQVSYSLGLDGTGIWKDKDWTGERRAPGELQMALSDFYQSQARFWKGAREYNNLILKIEDQVDLLEAMYDLHADEITLRWNNQSRQSTLSDELKKYRVRKYFWEKVAGASRKWSTIFADMLKSKSIGWGPFKIKIYYLEYWNPKNIIKMIGEGLANISEIAAGINLSLENDKLKAKEQASLITDLHLEFARNNFQAEQRVKELEQLIRREPTAALEMYTLKEIVYQSMGRYQAKLAEGERLLTEMAAFRRATAAEMQTYRYRDMAFRIFRNDAIQKFRAQFELAARYAYLTATAYDYETSLLGTAGAAGRNFLTDIVRHRGLGQVLGGQPVAGSSGLADPLARMAQNFAVLKGQLGFNNPQDEANRFSLRAELFRIGEEAQVPGSDQDWRDVLSAYRVDNLWDVPEYRRYARPFAPEPWVDPNGPLYDPNLPAYRAQPGIVIGLEIPARPLAIPMSTTVTAGLNYFERYLGGGDSAYDPSHFATKIRSVGVWFRDYESLSLSNTPRVYLIPAGMDILRSPEATDFTTREWRVVDQKVPVPFPVNASDLADPDWTPLHDGLSDDLADIRRFSAFRVYHDSGGFDATELTTDTRLIGRSVWNTRWLLIIPGDALLNPPDKGLDDFVGDVVDPGVSDILLYFQTYAYSGN